ncbi:aldehyde dehydrogenase [Microbacterium sp. 18062]|uniref:aldehyde dehydrogenase family protein n=1 Tax=Microbacterium sp. 18062 TaxID=2681410 RepID=UPI00135A62EC|nr:aldehyde dehydrogenase family protein [Microbacterium sp. 18062]
MPDTLTRAPLWPRSADGLPAAAAVGVPGGGEGAPIAVDDPATRRIVGWCLPTPPEGIAAAVDVAAAGFRTWSALTPAERAAAIHRGADAIAERAEDLARSVTSEVGKPLSEARGDVGGGVQLLRSFADLAEEAAEIHDLTGRPGAGAADEVLLHRVPVGPMAVITPWNTPVYLALNCVAPALAAGCSVVVKPAEAAPLSLTAALALLAAELPAGAVTVVQGTGAAVGAALCRAPGIRGVSFVGGTVAGREVMRAAADTVKKVSLELGGNDPALVLEDAVLDDATLREIVAGCFSLAGQVCFDIKRIYVHRARHDEFVDRFTRMVDRIVVGPGADERVHMGPLTTEAGHRNALRLLQAARDAGAEVHEGGTFAPGVDPAGGRFVRPTVVSGISPDHELVLTEQFAPIVPIVAVDDDAVAVREANRTEYGLCSSVWSADPDHARAVALGIEAGNTFVNAHRVGASVPLVPFGGVKQSGLGRNHLMHAIAECTEEHAVIRYTDPAAQIRGIDHWADLTSEDTP